MPRYACDACGAKITAEDARAGTSCPRCGREAIITVATAGERLEKADDAQALEDELGEDVQVTSLGDDEVDEPEILPCEAALVAPMGGIEKGSLTLVTGEPSAGKSFECTRVAIALDELLDPARVVYLDREMGKVRCKALFREAGAGESFLKRITYVQATTWQKAIELFEDADVGILDSFHDWVPDGERAAALRALLDLSRRGPTLLVIAHFAHSGHASGPLAYEHKADCTIVVRQECFEVRKCRWRNDARGKHPRAPHGAPANSTRSTPASSARAPRPPSPWEVLGVEKGATAAQIKAAWRTRSAEYHPDKVAHLGEKLRELAAQEMLKINAAFEALKKSAPRPTP
jgi:predicted ATP-dependent serine protease